MPRIELSLEVVKILSKMTASGGSSLWSGSKAPALEAFSVSVLLRGPKHGNLRVSLDKVRSNNRTRAIKHTLRIHFEADQERSKTQALEAELCST